MEWKFETLVEKIKFDVLREVAKACYAGNFKEVESTLPEILIPGRKANYRCCVYMERAIMAERIKIIRGGAPEDFNIIDVIPIACDQCPMGGYTVTESCRSCIGHACKQACPKGAISIDAHHRAHIDKEKCVNCGLCAKACPFGAIYNFRRPCQKACPVGAITMDENLSAKIDYSKCITCGQCTQKCPFGAISDKTFMTFIIDHIRNNILAPKKRPIYAIIAPAVAAQFPSFKLSQIYEGILALGFTNICEASLGADLVTMEEGRELVKKKVLTSSCCPAFVEYILKFHPELKDKVSSTPSPMAVTAREIKKKYPDALTVFIGPCACKKMERCKPEVRQYVDYVLTFVELRAMFAARDVDLTELKGISLDDGSIFGRNFARSGGVADAVAKAIKELDIKDFKLTSLSCNGMKDCIKALDNLSTGVSPYNFIEGMSCEGGCVCGPGSLNHSPAVGKAYVQNHARQASRKTILESAKRYDKSLADVEIKIEKIIPKVTAHTEPVSFGNVVGKKIKTPIPTIPFEEYRKSMLKRDKTMSETSIFAKTLASARQTKEGEEKMPIEDINLKEQQNSDKPQQPAKSTINISQPSAVGKSTPVKPGTTPTPAAPAAATADKLVTPTVEKPTAPTAPATPVPTTPAAPVTPAAKPATPVTPIEPKTVTPSAPVTPAAKPATPVTPAPVTPAAKSTAPSTPGSVKPEDLANPHNNGSQPATPVVKPTDPAATVTNPNPTKEEKDEEEPPLPPLEE